MSFLLVFLLLFFNNIDASHFNGGTIRWAPIDPFDSSSSVKISITQSYSWNYPNVSCAANVPISTGAYNNLNTNLTCVADCLTDGGYSQAPVDILTDCISYSTSLGVMSSERTVNITLNGSAYFYIAYTGSAWRNLNNPPQSGLTWSILSLINLQKRDDGIINTPPVVNVISPQYVIVNMTTKINILVSDINGDDVRCRWSVYRPGYRRRREANEDISHLRKKRQGCSICNSGTCTYNCSCSCPACQGTTCTGLTCSTTPSCPTVTTLTTSPFLHSPIDECGGICHTNGLPNDATLSNCTLSFTGPVAGIWYGIALQVEDFINDTSTVPMSSVPVQFLIYVLPTPTCIILPLILPLTDCLNVEVGISINVTLYAMNLCGSTVTITDILVSQGISGMIADNLINSTTNSSLVFVTFTWTPQVNQVGLQQLCTIAFNNLFAQSSQYCVTFTVTTSSTSTIQVPSKSTNSINISLIVGLSFLGLALILCLCGCLVYHLFWSDAAHRRRERQAQGDIQQNQYSFLNPSVITRNLTFKRPSQSYLIHNITDHRNSTYTYPSSMPTGLSSVPNMNIINSNIDISIDNTDIIENSLLKSSRHQSTDEISLPLYSAIRMNNMSRNENQNTDSGSIKAPFTKFPRKKLSKIHDLTNDNNANGNFIDIKSKSAINKDENVNNIKLKRNEISSTSRRHSDSIDNQYKPKEHSARRESVGILKLRRSSNYITPMENYEKSASTENDGKYTDNQVNVTLVTKKLSKTQSHSSNPRSSIDHTND